MYTNNPLKTVFPLRNILITICVKCDCIVIYISYSKNKFLMDYQMLLVYKNSNVKEPNGYYKEIIEFVIIILGCMCFLFINMYDV